MGFAMKQPVTFRLYRDLLAKARRSAAAENRTLTKFDETVLKGSVEAPSQAGVRTVGRRSPSPDRF